MADLTFGEVFWERMIRAVERVRERLARSTKVLERAGISYAVVGGHAVASWVSRLDESATRNTPDVDLLIRREDYDMAEAALVNAGFVYYPSSHPALFLDGPEGKIREAVRVFFANERVRPEDLLAMPDPSQSELSAGLRILSLECLVGMKLTLFRTKDRVHVSDMIDVGLIDETWLPKLPPELAARLQEILDTPDG